MRVALGGCKATTKLGNRCQAKDVFSNGYCKHHGGQGTLPRIERLIHRSKLRSDRLMRKLKRAAKTNPHLAAILERRSTQEGSKAL